MSSFIHMPHRIAKQIYIALQGAKNILLVPHQKPDGDALGSVTALMHLLRTMEKKHAIFCATEYTKKLNFLPGVETLTTNPDIWKKEQFDLVLVVDSGDLGYAGVSHHIYELNPKPFIINIDHHPTNERFGDLNLVIEKASSTCEILYNFFVLNNLNIDSHIATCLLTGIITDTGNFTNSATTVQSLQIASNLIRKGANIKLIKEIVFKDKSVDGLKLWGTMLSRLTKHDTHQIVYTYITQQEMKDHHVDDSEVEGVANFMNSLSEGKAALVLKELPDGKVKGSFRTTRDDVDVSHYAKKLGGGGHVKAAGFTVDGPVDTALEQIWSTLEEVS